MFFMSVHHMIHHMIPRDKFLDYLKQVLLLNAFEAFLRSSILDKTVFVQKKTRYVSKW